MRYFPLLVHTDFHVGFQGGAARGPPRRCAPAARTVSEVFSTAIQPPRSLRKITGRSDLTELVQSFKGNSKTIAFNSWEDISAKSDLTIEQVRGTHRAK